MWASITTRILMALTIVDPMRIHVRGESMTRSHCIIVILRGKLYKQASLESHPQFRRPSLSSRLTMGISISSPSAADSHLDLPFGPTVATPASDGLILRLPDEVLDSVFTLVARAEPIHSIHDRSRSSTSEDNSYYARLGWTRLSGVCRRWRAVLISLAPLWANIVFHLPPEPALLALSRSSEAPLDMRIPSLSLASREGRFTAMRRRLTRAKSTNEPHSHRERLLTLATTYAPRMGQLYGADFSAQEFLDIFKCASFDRLRALVFRQDCPGEPSREILGQLHILAPKVERAHLPVTLPIAHENGPGLKLSLPALRDLELFDPPSYTGGIDTLRWISPLLREATELRSLVIYLSGALALPIDWAELVGEESTHLDALRAIRFTGCLNACLDQLFTRVITVIPPHICFVVTDYLQASDIAQMLRFGEIIGNSLRVHPLDSMTITRGVRTSNDAFNLVAFSSDELPGPHYAIPGLLSDTRRRARLSATLSARMISGLAGDTLDGLAPVFCHNAVKHLVIDEDITDDWMQALRRFSQSCLRDVTTLHCTYYRNPMINGKNPMINGELTETSPCTSARRLLDDSAESADMQVDSPVQDEGVGLLDHKRQLTFDSGPCLPALETLVVTMCVPKSELKKMRRRSSLHPSTGAVRAWWEDLVQAIAHRREIGLGVRTLRLVGGWESQLLHRATAEIDAKMFAQAAELVDEIVDERIVGLTPTCIGSPRNITQPFLTRQAFPTYISAW
ncbi:hypothetical protein PENSPDRAFT_670740 [Peniophora sp. CONT]|nr:hypothetical protein PENSPDRAFT_670740 [Peniophora sp. CONT]